MNFKIKIGDFGQKIAADFLSKRGYKILTEKFYTRVGEIDLVLEKDNQLVFAEVKTRLSDKFGLAEEAVDVPKKQKLYQAALRYLEKNQIENDNFRFDIVAVEIDKENNKARIRHHKGILF